MSAIEHGGKATCIFPGCDGTILYARGICRKHYATAVKNVQVGNTTWAELESLGLCGMVRSRGPRNSFLAVLESARSRNGAS